jgi:hypothetical protein
MASNVIGTIGGQYAELNNAATEATLQELLKLARGQATNVAKMASAAGVKTSSSNATPVSNNDLKAFADEAQQASKSTKSFSNAGYIAGSVLGDLTGSTIKTTSNLVGFAEHLIDGNAKLSEFYGALKDLPLGLGLVASLFQKLAKFQESNLEAYRALTDSGIGFAGDLSN